MFFSKKSEVLRFLADQGICGVSKVSMTGSAAARRFHLYLNVTGNHATQYGGHANGIFKQHVVLVNGEGVPLPGSASPETIAWMNQVNALLLPTNISLS